MIKQIIVATIVTFSFVACSGTKKVTSNDTDSNTATVSENKKIEQENRTTQTAGTETPVPDKSVGGVAGQTNGSGGAMNNVQATGGNASSSMDYDRMYTDLEMNDDQINSFRAAMEAFQKTRINKPNGEMMGSIEDERNRQLGSILSKEQFSKYQKWQAENNNN